MMDGFCKQSILVCENTLTCLWCMTVSVHQALKQPKTLFDRPSKVSVWNMLVAAKLVCVQLFMKTTYQNSVKVLKPNFAFPRHFHIDFFIGAFKKHLRDFFDIFFAAID